MATERKNVVDRLKDLTQCCICADTLTDARVLPCLHTFCLQCLQLAGADRRPYHRMPCPICRNEFSIPRQGFSGLQKNFLMENLLEMASLPSFDETGENETTTTLPENGDNALPCDVCSDDGKVEDTSVGAVVYCVDCHQSLCRLCYNHHKRLPATKLHRFSDDAEVVGEFRRVIAGDVEAVSAWMAEGETKKKGVLEDKTTFVDEMTKVEEEVKRMRDKAKEVVDSRAASLLQELATSKQKHLDQFQGSLDQIEGHLAVLESFMKRCMHAKDVGTADDVVCRVAEDLKRTAEDLHHMHELKLKEQVVAATVPIDVSQLDPFLDKWKKEEKPVSKEQPKKNKGASTSREQHQTECSSIHSTDVVPSIANNYKTTKHHSVALLVLVSSVVLALLLNAFIPRVHPVSLSLSTRLSDNHSVMGVTVIEDNIYVLSGSLGSVLVYQARDPFDLVKKIAIPEIKSPWDMVGSSKSSCLYISDKDTSCVWKISLKEVQREGWFLNEKYEYLVSRWLCGINDPHTLSISDDGTTLLLLSGSPPLLRVYDHDSTLIRSLELPLNVEDPRHAVQSSSGSYIVSYGWSGTKTQGIMELDSNGRILRANEPLYDWQQLKNPHHLALDAADRVFVADFYNNRVLLLDSKLHWDQREVLTEDRDDISKPHRLALDRSNKQLIVAHSDGSRVDVYAIDESN